MRAGSTITTATATALAAIWCSAAAAQSHGSVAVSDSVRQDVSPALRDMEPLQEVRGERPEEHRVRPLPLPQMEGALDLKIAEAAQSEPEAAVPTRDKLNFAGVGDGDYGFSPDAAPPDTNGAVGETQYVQWVNESFAVFDKKTGKLLFGPVAGKTLWQGFGGQCEHSNDGDVIAQYDKIGKRWVLAQFAVEKTPFLQCVAVSQTSDATGAYNRYAYNYGADFPDYPKIGVWPDGYYVTYNMFGPRSFEGSRVCALDRSRMLQGKPARQQCVQLSSRYGGLLPSDLDGAILPPKGSPNYLLSLGTSKSLFFWRYHVDWADPANTALSDPIRIHVPDYVPGCHGGACIPQMDTKGRLDSLADRLMYRLAYRNFGDHEALVVNHSVRTNQRVGVRWYEVRDPSGTPTLYQSGTFAPGGKLFRWMGSIAMDKAGDIALGYSTSSPTDYPSIAYTGRAAGDPLGQMDREQTVISGTGSQNGGLDRWGDYSAMSVDPEDDCTFYYTQEYQKETGAFNWSTRINSFKFNGCRS